jgi:hypothetical protein
MDGLHAGGAGKWGVGGDCDAGFFQLLLRPCPPAHLEALVRELEQQAALAHACAGERRGRSEGEGPCMTRAPLAA